MRTFEDRPAVRERVPLLVGLVGPSSSGKTYSALRLATGMQRVDGGEIFFIDTEARRALHYADRFSFRHVPFTAPFGPMDYLAAFEHCVNKGATVIIVDSMSHEHEGPGGVLEMHAAETKRLAKAWRTSEAAAQMSAWNAPKSQRRRMVNTALQLPVHFIFCFRAKPKLKIQKGKDPEPRGWMPIAGEELVYELGVRALLLPGADGVPEWDPKEPGEIETVKMPVWARGMFPPNTQLNEDMGAALALWAAGTEAPTVESTLAALNACVDPAELGTLKINCRGLWKAASKHERESLTRAMEAAVERVKAATAEPEPDDDAAANEGTDDAEESVSDAAAE